MLCLCALRPFSRWPAAASCPQGAGVANKSLAHAGGGNRQSISCLSTAGQFSSSQKENNIRRTAPHPSPYHYHRPYLRRSLAASGQSTSLIASLPPPSNTNSKKYSLLDRSQPWISTLPWAWSRWTPRWALRGLAQRGFLPRALEALPCVLTFDRILCCNCGSPIDGTASAGALCFDW